MTQVYESLAEGPDALLLLMDHVPYTHVLHSGKTVIQHIYESHYKGAAPAASYVQQWKSRVTRIDEQRYRELLARLEYQAGHAEVWRDAVNSWFLRTSGIPNRKGRSGAETTASHCTAGRAVAEPSYENLFQSNRRDKRRA